MQCWIPTTYIRIHPSIAVQVEYNLFCRVIESPQIRYFMYTDGRPFLIVSTYFSIYLEWLLRTLYRLSTGRILYTPRKVFKGFY
jgi:hypothetical protein